MAYLKFFRPTVLLCLFTGNMRPGLWHTKMFGYGRAAVVHAASPWSIPISAHSHTSRHCSTCTERGPFCGSLRIRQTLPLLLGSYERLFSKCHRNINSPYQQYGEIAVDHHIVFYLFTGVEDSVVAAGGCFNPAEHILDGTNCLCLIMSEFAKLGHMVLAWLLSQPWPPSDAAKLSPTPGDPPGHQWWLPQQPATQLDPLLPELRHFLALQ